jgi:hypothetical protein
MIDFVGSGHYTQLSLKFGGDEKLLRRVVVFDVENIRLTADLAVFHVNLAAAGGLIYDGRIPFSARRALETGFHNSNEHTL